MAKANIKLDLTDQERSALRKQKIKKSDILNFTPMDLEQLLNVSETRAKELIALADFQRIPSIGIEFAKDLIFLEIFSVDALQDKDGASLTDAYEKKKGYQIDPCVEDQFRLAVHFSQHQDYTKRWWHFTEARKAYRQTFGSPDDRPSLNWNEL